MADPSDPLVKLLLGPGQAGYGASLIIGAVCTAWNTSTGANTVTDGARKWTDLPFIGPAASGTTGAVLLLTTPSLPVIIGRLNIPTP